MIQITDKEGRMLPAIRNLFTLVFCAVFFCMGWFGHANWSIRGEADQLIKDAKTSAKAREVKKERVEVLNENVKQAMQVPEANDCNCGDATDVEFMRQLRKTREEGSFLDRGNPFPIHSD